MQVNIILAGVGGQGILTIARAISLVALRKGWHIKQAEVHGMSQRGGAVQSHLRISEREIHSELIPIGEANLIISLEPLEALRYLEYLSESGAIIANEIPLTNIADYGDARPILQRIARRPHHVLIDANRLAGLAGSSHSVNMVMFGAACAHLDLDAHDCRAVITQMMASKGGGVVQTSLQAFELGREAAGLYHEGLACGISPSVIRSRLACLTLAELESGFQTGIDWGESGEPAVSPQAVQGVDRILSAAAGEGRAQLSEPEVYAIIDAVGAIEPPRHRLVRDPAEINADMIAGFPGQKIILKIVSPEIVHKSDLGMVASVPRDPDLVAEQAAALIARARQHADRVDGVLLVEFVEHAAAGFGGELFVGIRSTPQFGPVLAAGLGGVDTEFLAAKLRSGLAVAKAPVCEISADGFFRQFQTTVAYEILSGNARGHRRIVSDGALRRCFRAFHALARRFCTARDDNGPEIVELEVNPFAFRGQTMIPLDGRARLGKNVRQSFARACQNVDKLLDPRSIAMVGVSSKRQNFGRIILNNTLACGFPPESLYVIKPDEESIDGARCVPDLASLPGQVDLLVIATGAGEVPSSVKDALASGRIAAAIVIAAGLGERAGTESTRQMLSNDIDAARRSEKNATVFLGGNCLGVRSRPGRYDTFFIPDRKLDPRRSARPRSLALVSQSGAFIVNRLSNIPTCDPVFTVSVGNQMDLTLSDLVAAVGRRDEVDVIGIYAEGFRDWDGLELVRAIRKLAASGKVVIFYKAGRTESGRAATQGHTACLAGDYDVCLSAMEQAGALVTETVREFEQLTELALAFHDLPVHGCSVAAITNAGSEAVAMADAVSGPGHRVDLFPWSPQSTQRIKKTLSDHRLDSLVNLANPVDLTPVAPDAVYQEIVSAALQDAAVDAVVVSVVPLTPELLSTPEESNDPRALCNWLPTLAREFSKPVLVVVNDGEIYRPYVRRMRDAGLPVIQSGDEAVRALGRYLCHRRALARDFAAEPGAAPPQPQAAPRGPAERGVASACGSCS